MAGGLSYFYQRGEAVPKASSLPAVIISYHPASVNLVCHSFFIYGQHYLYRQEEIKAKPPSIAKWLAAYPLASEGRSHSKSVIPSCRYYIIPYDGYQLGLSLVFLYAANTICTGKWANFLPTYLPSFSRFIASPLTKYSRASALSCSTCVRSSSSPANLRSGRRNSINLTRMKRP